MRKLLYIIVAAILFATCLDNRKQQATLDTSQKIIYDNPDSALAILNSLEASS